MGQSRFFMLVILIAATSCRKSVVEIDTNYIGNWYGFSPHLYYLSIDSNGYGHYHREKWQGGEEGVEDWEGEVKASNTHIKIGGSPCFKIIKEPTPMDTNVIYNSDTLTWELILKYPKTIGYDGAQFTVYK